MPAVLLVLLFALGQQVDWKTHHQRGLEATQSGRLAEAEKQYREALRLKTSG